MEMLDTSDTSFWAPENLLEPQSLQHQDLHQPPHQFSGLRAETVLAEEICVGQDSYGCGGYNQPPHPAQHTELQLPLDDRHLMPPPTGAPEFSGRDAGVDNHNPTSIRKLHKADRERLRRDHLNEQFTKLAGVLDPVRPKNDKGTILAESIAAVNELRSEIARLKSEHVNLSDESKDLTQEKVELREEKTTLETETNRLQNQLNQNMEAQNAVPGWMKSMDPSGLLQMGSSPHFPYPLSVPQSTLFSKENPDKSMAEQPMQETAVPPPSAFLSQVPLPGPFMHPAFQAYGIYNAGYAGPPYMPYPHAAHVERPHARYPSPVLHPTPKFAEVPTAKSSAVKSTEELPSVVTELQLQTPGVPLPPASSMQQTSV